MENLCQHASVTLGRCSSNGQNYAIVCPNLTYLWRHPEQRYLINLLHEANIHITQAIKTSYSP